MKNMSSGAVTLQLEENKTGAGATKIELYDFRIVSTRCIANNFDLNP